MFSKFIFVFLIFHIHIYPIISGGIESDNVLLKGQFDDLKTDVELILTELNISRIEQDLVKMDNDRISSELKRQAQLIDNIVKNFGQCMEAEESYGRNCAEAAVNKGSGIHKIRIRRFNNDSFKVACDMKTLGGNWTIILRRMDGSVNFYRDWRAYKNGFGDLDGEFFLGLDKIHALTSDEAQELLVLLEDMQGENSYEMYEKFGIGDEHESYALQILGAASGNAGDSLSNQFAQKFSTYDHYETYNCAREYRGAWWYKDCHKSQLTGVYGNNLYGRGVNWYDFRGYHCSLKRAVMMIRPRKLRTVMP